MASNLNPKVMKSLPDLLKEKAISHKKLFSDYSDKNDEIIETDHLENKNEEKPENENEENKDVINRSKTTKRKKSKFKLLVKHEEKNENEDNVDNEINQKYIVNDGNFTEKTKNNNDNKISRFTSCSVNINHVNHHKNEDNVEFSNNIIIVDSKELDLCKKLRKERNKIKRIREEIDAAPDKKLIIDEEKKYLKTEKHEDSYRHHSQKKPGDHITIKAISKLKKNRLMMPELKMKSSNNNLPNSLKIKSISKASKNNMFINDIKSSLVQKRIDILLSIINGCVLIEIEISNIIDMKNTIKLDDEAKQMLYNKALKLLNEFLEDIRDNDDIEISFFINKNYNLLLEKEIKLIICLNCIMFVIMAQINLDNSLCLIENYYNDVLKDLYSIIYNIYDKFMDTEIVNLNEEEIFNLGFKQKMMQLFKANKTHIRNTLPPEQIYSALDSSIDICFKKFSEKILDTPKCYIEPIYNSMTTLLLNIDKNNIKYFIEIIINVLLYSILKRNVNRYRSSRKFNLTKNSKQVNYSPPYLPEKDKNYKYTLVLDMDETLVHYISTIMAPKNVPSYAHNVTIEKNISLNLLNCSECASVGMFLLRPHLINFLEELKGIYEIVIFTAGTKEYCNKIMDMIDLDGDIFKYRLHRSHVKADDRDFNIKDLSLLGRDLAKTIIVDNNPENFKLQENNGLPINTWVGDINDTDLKDLLPILKFIAKKNVSDVRRVIKKIKSKMNNAYDKLISRSDSNEKIKKINYTVIHVKNN